MFSVLSIRLSFLHFLKRGSHLYVNLRLLILVTISLYAILEGCHYVHVVGREAVFDRASGQNRAACLNSIHFLCISALGKAEGDVVALVFDRFRAVDQIKLRLQILINIKHNIVRLMI